MGPTTPHLENLPVQGLFPNMLHPTHQYSRQIDDGGKDRKRFQMTRTGTCTTHSKRWGTVAVYACCCTTSRSFLVLSCRSRFIEQYSSRWAAICSDCLPCSLRSEQPFCLRYVGTVYTNHAGLPTRQDTKFVLRRMLPVPYGSFKTPVLTC